MNNSPLISIITPCHNSARTLIETVNSIKAQTYDNWELIIIDDGSEDDSLKIAKVFQKMDSRIHTVSLPKASGSPSIPRNIGIDMAKGEYIAFLDSDDIWLPDKLEHQIKFMLDSNSPFTYSFYEKISWDGQRDNRIVKTRSVTTYNNLLKSNSIPILTTVISKKLIGETRFKNIPQEDFCFWLDILKKGYTAININKITALYRESNNSRSANKLSMFAGYWNVIRNYQNRRFIPSCYYMIIYSILGILKYIK